MNPTDSAEITQLLRAWQGGDPPALEKLTPIVYSELHRVAEQVMHRDNRGNSLQAMPSTRKASPAIDSLVP